MEYHYHLHTDGRVLVCVYPVEAGYAGSREERFRLCPAGFWHWFHSVNADHQQGPDPAHRAAVPAADRNDRIQHRAL